MKIIVTGATGNTGGHVIERLLSLPTVTSVIVLARRALPEKFSSPKITTFTLTDEEFRSYPADLVEAIKDADGCVWALGGLPKGTEEEMMAQRQMYIDYVYALLQAVVANPPLSSGQPFRLAYTGGSLVPEDPNAPLWFRAPSRKQGAEAMLGFHKFAEENSSKVDIIIAKPWYISPASGGSILLSLIPSYHIPVNVLAAALVHFVLNGNKEKNIRNVALKEIGLSVLKETP